MSSPSIPEPAQHPPKAARAYLLPAVLLALATLGPLLAVGLEGAHAAAAEAARRQAQAAALDDLHARLAAAVFAASPVLVQTPPLPGEGWLAQTLRLHGGLATHVLTIESGPERFDSAGSMFDTGPPLLGSRRQLVAGIRVADPDGVHLRRDLVLRALPVGALALAGNIRWSQSQIHLWVEGPLLLQPDGGSPPLQPDILQGRYWACDAVGRPLPVAGHPPAPGWRWLPPADPAFDPTPGAAEADAVEIDLAASLATPSSWGTSWRVIGSWRIGGQDGAFGGEPGHASALPFAGLRVTGSTAARLHIDLQAWDGPSRILVRGSSGWVIIAGTDDQDGGPVRVDIDAPGATVVLNGPNLRPAIICAHSARLSGDPPWHGILILRDHLRIEDGEEDSLPTIRGTIAGSPTLIANPDTDRPSLRIIADPALGESLRRHGLHLPSWVLASLE